MHRLIYSWGSGISGQLGVEEEKSSQPLPKLIKDFSNSEKKKIIAAFDVSCAITEADDIYVWGKARDGALGVFPGGSVNINLPSLFVHTDKLDSKPVDIDFSKEHGALVTLKGSLYTWGVDMYNKLGHIEDPEQKKLQSNQKQKRTLRSSYDKVKFGKVLSLENEKIVSAKCGYNHTICLTEDGEVYSWGYGKDGALGHSNFENSLAPKKIEYFSQNGLKIKKIECGDYFSMALTNDGKIYTWGMNNYGQLGLGQISHKLKINLPTEVGLRNKIVSEIFAGEDHCACVTEEGEGYIWGYGLDGRLGNKSKMNQNTPTKLAITSESSEIAKIKKIACGGHMTAILTESGDVYMCGNGRDGELGRGNLLESYSVNRDEPLLVTQFNLSNEKVIDVACGSSHTLALVEK